MSPLPTTESGYSQSDYKPRSLIDPHSIPNFPLLGPIAGNAPSHVKQLTHNVFWFYGVVSDETFGYCAGKHVKFTNISVDQNASRKGRIEATTYAELEVRKEFLNGGSALHGGVVAYLIDNCASTPLVVLGLISNVNGVGVTSSMTINFHSPALLGTQLQIISTSVALGNRIMSSRCEIIDKKNGRLVASAFLNKMQPGEAAKL